MRSYDALKRLAVESNVDTLCAHGTVEESLHGSESIDGHGHVELSGSVGLPLRVLFGTFFDLEDDAVLTNQIFDCVEWQLQGIDPINGELLVADFGFGCCDFCFQTLSTRVSFT